MADFQLENPSRPTIDRFTSPFVRFAQLEAASGILLLAATAAALIWANSAFASSYHAILHTPAIIGLGPLSISKSLHGWVDDGLMSVFFFFVGLEIKRELLTGELASFRRAIFPFMAAFGGALFPVLIFLSLNHGTSDAGAWAVPMATDIAFVLGVLALLGNKVPQGLKVFVAALAIVDDLFAVVVIALFYTDKIALLPLALGLLGVGLAFAANRIGVRSPLVYALLSVAVWFAILYSGVHSTIAGVLMACTIPVKADIDKPIFLANAAKLLDRFRDLELHTAESHAAVYALESQCAQIESPLHRMEHALQPWVSFLIMPAFALCNAGVNLRGQGKEVIVHALSLGVILGLLVGKPLGITLFSWLTSVVGLGARPASVTWGQIFAASCLCGIGFTMSLFIANLALPGHDTLDLCKIAVLTASAIAGLGGSVVLRWFLPRGRTD